MSAKLKKKFQSYNILKSQNWKSNSVDLDEVAHHEPPNLDLHCLQCQLFFIFDPLRIKFWTNDDNKIDIPIFRVYTAIHKAKFMYF